MSLQETADIMVQITVSTDRGELPDPKYLEQLVAERLFGSHLDWAETAKVIAVGINGQYFVEEFQ